MDNQRSPLLSWAYYYQGKSMEELRQSLLITTLELETTKLKAEEELKMRDEQLTHLKDLFSKAIKERDEAQDKCQRLLFEKLLLQQQFQQTAPLSGISSIEDEPRRGLDSNNGFSSSDCEESIVSSPVIDPIPPPPLQAPPPPPLLVPEKPLPEKGKLLQAVMKAGPLLQNLLLAGPLPQWRHPPPPLDSYQIPPPPVVIPQPQPPPTHHLLHQDSLLNISAISNNIDNCGSFNRKRGLCEGGSESPTERKYQRVVLQ
uniref:Putative arp2/3 complex-activating protein rickA-like n=1 Tax=Davidia involucrata TaxID=16924 RepID=A0A5B7AE64_DAVIN